MADKQLVLEAYHRADNKFNAAFAIFNPIHEAFGKGDVSDSVYAEARAEMQIAKDRFDKAFKAVQDLPEDGYWN